MHEGLFYETLTWSKFILVQKYSVGNFRMYQFRVLLTNSYIISIILWWLQYRTLLLYKYLIPSVSDEKYEFQISIDKKLSLFVLLLDDFRFGMITLLNFLRMRINKIYTHFLPRLILLKVYSSFGLQQNKIDLHSSKNWHTLLQNDMMLWKWHLYAVDLLHH